MKQSEKDAVLDHFGHMYEKIGSTYTIGRCYGLCLLAESPISQDRFCTELHLSQSVVSTTVRQLLHIGVLEKTRIKGSRKLHYKVPAHAAQLAGSATVAKMTLFEEALVMASLLELGEVATARIKDQRLFYQELSTVVLDFVQTYTERLQES